MMFPLVGGVPLPGPFAVYRVRMCRDWTTLPALPSGCPLQCYCGSQQQSRSAACNMVGPHQRSSLWGISWLDLAWPQPRWGALVGCLPPPAVCRIWTFSCDCALLATHILVTSALGPGTTSADEASEPPCILGGGAVGSNSDVHGRWPPSMSRILPSLLPYVCGPEKGRGGGNYCCRLPCSSPMP